MKATLNKLIAIAILFASVMGCIAEKENEVVVYAALDREFSEPILQDIGAELNLNVLPRYDVESNKTVGLANAIIAEKNRPRCDIFWNNEILHTLRLQEEGLLEAWTCEPAKRFPSEFVSDQGQWFGFAARARVLIVNTDLVPEAQRPRSINDLLDIKWKKKCCVARPLFGTSATQAAVMFDTLGDEAATDFYRRLAENATVLGGNKQVAQKVASGEFAFGLTDTDDAIIEVENANPVAIVFPDQGEGETGTLFIPNTLCVIKNGPNSIRAKRLVERLLAADIESRLAGGASAQIPLAGDVEARSRVEPEAELKFVKVDFQAAAKRWNEVSKTLLEIFPTGGK
ncbi:extracellular solute-binding protein [Mariniblastus fucicola]|nr:extracellular solute-binding protein [Mariniblastus fucicola]